MSEVIYFEAAKAKKQQKTVGKKAVNRAISTRKKNASSEEIESKIYRPDKIYINEMKAFLQESKAYFKREYQLTKSELKVFIFIASSINWETKKFWMKQANMAKKLEISIRTVSYALKKLEEENLIVIRRSKKESTHYFGFAFKRPYEFFSSDRKNFKTFIYENTKTQQQKSVVFASLKGDIAACQNAKKLTEKYFQK